jgi:nucleoside-diphosphate-sugar epimerase
MARALGAAGWQVRPWRRGADDLSAMAQGADVIVMASNPPYHRWAAEMPALHAAARDAALASGALVLFPGNVYVYGAGSGPVLGVDTPHAATNPLGRLRIGVEQAYARAGVRTLILRAGDFLDTAPSGNWFDRLMVPGLPKGVLRYPGPPGAAHAWAFLPDMARAALGLLADPARFRGVTEVPFAGYTLTGADMAAALARVTGCAVALQPFPWWQLRLLRPVMPVLGGVLEMRYLWDMPHRLDDGPLRALLPDFAPTPLDDALRAATAHLRLAAAPAGDRAPARP